MCQSISQSACQSSVNSALVCKQRLPWGKLEHLLQYLNGCRDIGMRRIRILSDSASIDSSHEYARPCSSSHQHQWERQRRNHPFRIKKKRNSETELVIMQVKFYTLGNFLPSKDISTSKWFLNKTIKHNCACSKRALNREDNQTYSIPLFLAPWPSYERRFWTRIRSDLRSVL